MDSEDDVRTSFLNFSVEKRRDSDLGTYSQFTDYENAFDSLQELISGKETKYVTGRWKL